MSTVDPHLPKLAEAATPGPWFVEHGGVFNATRGYMVVPTGDSDQDRADAAFIAAANPAAIAELIERARRLDAFASVAGDLWNVIEGYLSWNPDSVDGCQIQEVVDRYEALARDRQDPRPVASSTGPRSRPEDRQAGS